MFSNLIAPEFIKQGESCLPGEIFTQIITLLNMIFCYISCWYHVPIGKNTSCTFSSDIYVSTIFLHASHIIGTSQIKIDPCGGWTI